MQVPAITATSTQPSQAHFATDNLAQSGHSSAQILTLKPDEFQRLQAIPNQIQPPARRSWLGLLKAATVGTVGYLLRGTFNGLKNVARMFHPSQWKQTARNVAIGTAVITAGSTMFLWHFAPLAIPFNAVASLAMDMVFEFGRGFFQRQQPQSQSAHHPHLSVEQLMHHLNSQHPAKAS